MDEATKEHVKHYRELVGYLKREPIGREFDFWLKIKALER